MRKILAVCAALCCAAALYAASCDDNAGMCEGFKAPTVSVDVDSMTKNKKEKDKESAKIQEIAQRYNAAAAKDKPKIKKELESAVTEKFSKKLAFERAQITRQEAKLAAWKENLSYQEQNKAALIKQETEDILAGQDNRTAWDKLKEKTEAKSDSAKKKALKKAAAKGK